MQVGFIISLFFAILVAVFALRNGNNVNIDFLFAKIQVSQAIVIFVSAALGAVIVTILGLVRHLKLSMKIKEQSKLISSLENEKQTLESKIEGMTEKETASNMQTLNSNNDGTKAQEENTDNKENGKVVDNE